MFNDLSRLSIPSSKTKDQGAEMMYELVDAAKRALASQLCSDDPHVRDVAEQVISNAKAKIEKFRAE